MNYGPEIKKELVGKLYQLGFATVSELRKKLNVAQPYVRKGTKYIGLDPSLPGKYPKKLSGVLMKSIAMNVDEDKLTLIVGTNQKHGRYLQFGTRKMRPRPFITLISVYVRIMTKRIFS